MPPHDQQHELLTIEQAAALLQLHPEWVRELCRDAQIPALKIRNHWRIPRTELLETMRNRAKETQDRSTARPRRPAPHAAEPKRAWLTQQEAATLLGVSVTTISRMLGRAALNPYTEPGKPGARRVANDDTFSSAWAERRSA